MTAAVAEDVQDVHRHTAKQPAHARKQPAPKRPAAKQGVTKPGRIEVRVTEEVQKLVELVVEFTGRSITDIVVAALVKEARQVVDDVNVIRLSREAQLAFVEALAAQPQTPVLNEAMQSAAQHHRRLIRTA
jgi:uncharacterized protein (DUF1778 family)